MHFDRLSPLLLFHGTHLHTESIAGEIDGSVYFVTNSIFTNENYEVIKRIKKNAKLACLCLLDSAISQKNIRLVSPQVK